jgi:UDP-N-acetylglucosamine:LPS N-acetylglucosamine transferase
MYSYADLSIVHGLWREEKPTDFKGYFSINTIVRNSISTIAISSLSNSIVCLLGGGSKSVNSGFTSGTIEIAKQVIEVAIINKYLNFTIYTSDENVKNEILVYIKSSNSSINNISIVASLTDEKVIFSQAKLVIARAGRNTISELLTMNMPSIIIPTKANYRGSEQLSNCEEIERNKYPFIRAHYLETGSTDLNDKMLQLINSAVFKNKDNFKPGNNSAVEIIMNTIQNNKSEYLLKLETKFKIDLKQN